jgi:5'-deoxynucleotidase YfbR-like HD superfamily hydrolase
MEKDLAESGIALGALALKFAATNRATLWPDGVTPESDTDHTVMLALVACAFAHTYEPSLDIGKVAQFALVHDLVEVYAGDTDTFGMTSEDHWKAKAAREEEALARIKKEFHTMLPWVSETIEEYESLVSPEARFIKTMDKTLPKITRLLNHGAIHDDPEKFRVHCERQLETMRASYGQDQKVACDFYEYLMKETLAMLNAKKYSATERPEA